MTSLYIKGNFKKKVYNLNNHINFAVGQDTIEEYCNIDPACIKEGVTYHSRGAKGKNEKIQGGGGGLWLYVFLHFN